MRLTAASPPAQRVRQEAVTMEESMSGMSERANRREGSPMNVAVFHFHNRKQKRFSFQLSTSNEVKRSRNRQENMAFSSREVVERRPPLCVC